MIPYLQIGGRKIGLEYPPLVIAEIGINHEGDILKAKKMIDDAYHAGAEIVKFQVHVIEDEMIPEAKKVIPGNATESIWNIMERCALSEDEDSELKEYTERLGMIYLSTPFSRAAAERLHRLGVKVYKIGSGECNNYPLIEHIASYGKPVILSTGMNDISSITPAVEILRKYKIPFALLHCTSLYPTPYANVRLGALQELKQAFPDAVLGLSDHSLGNYTCFSAVGLGASILEKHFTSDKTWPGPDVSISIDPRELKDLIFGSRAIHYALGGKKIILQEEKPTIDFAYACVVSIKDIKKGEDFTKENIWVKRPGTGEIKAVDYPRLLGKIALCDIVKNQQISWKDAMDAFAQTNPATKKKKILFITGTRADFGKLKSLLATLNNSKLFDVHIFATGMHLLPSYGYTIDEIFKCGFPNIHAFINHECPTTLGNILSNTIVGLGEYVKIIKPDMIVVHGDRVEALAGALVGSLNNIFVSHIEGGELSGTIDEHIRHSVSKMSHLHFVANEEAKKRIIQLGEDVNNIYVIGSPDLDIMNSTLLPTLEETKHRYDIPFNSYGLLVYHAVTTELSTLKEQTENLADAVLESQFNYIVIYPNDDPGVDIIQNIYSQKFSNNPHIRIYPSLRFEHFLTLLKNAHFIIGNSSAGVRESLFYGIPAINIGTRQNNRVKIDECKNIINSSLDKNEILCNIRRFISAMNRFESSAHFGEGKSHIHFLEVLKDENTWKKNIQKQFIEVPFTL